MFLLPKVYPKPKLAIHKAMIAIKVSIVNSIDNTLPDTDFQVVLDNK